MTRHSAIYRASGFHLGTLLPGIVIPCRSWMVLVDSLNPGTGLGSLATVIGKLTPRLFSVRVNDIRGHGVSFPGRICCLKP